MKINLCEKEAFVVIGKEGYGSSLSQTPWVKELWDDANKHFSEVYSIAKKDNAGNILGFWGAMSDETRAFNHWKNFNEGYYLAGVEAIDTCEAPVNWTKWTIPGYKYIYVKVDNNYNHVFEYVIKTYIPNNNYEIVGAVQEYYCPEEKGQLYLFFPIAKL